MANHPVRQVNGWLQILSASTYILSDFSFRVAPGAALTPIPWTRPVAHESLRPIAIRILPAQGFTRFHVTHVGLESLRIFATNLTQSCVFYPSQLSPKQSRCSFSEELHPFLGE